MPELSSVGSRGEPEDIDNLQTLIKFAKEEEESQLHSSSGVKNPEPRIIQRPELIDDYIRNFFTRNGLDKSLEAFQQEWYEVSQKGKARASEYANIPDVKIKNKKLTERIRSLRSQVEEANDAAERAKSTWGKLQKKKEYHKEHHKRIEDEKVKLKEDKDNLEQLQNLYQEKYQELSIKYEAAMKEKMLTKMEKTKLESQVRKQNNEIIKIEENIKNGGAASPKKPQLHQTQTEMETTGRKKRRIPQEDASNPYLSTNFESFPTKNLTETKCLKEHKGDVTALGIHPKRACFATGGDDLSWRLYGLPKGDYVAGKPNAHEDWISDVVFHPQEPILATCSGDCTIKVWHLTKQQQWRTFSDHTQPIWSIDFHYTGDFLVSGSMDQSCRLFDIKAEKQVSIMRGHVDSVTGVQFLPYSNTFATASADKSLSLWDVRTGLCAQTFYGHLNSVSDLDISCKVISSKLREMLCTAAMLMELLRVGI